MRAKVWVMGEGRGFFLGSLGLALLPLGLLLVFLIVPSLVLLAPSTKLEVLQATFANPYFQGRLLWTLAQAAGSTALTLLLGVPTAVVFSRYKFRAKPWLEAALTLPFVVPTVVASMGFLALLGPRGLFGIDLSTGPWLVVLANIFYNFALVVRLVSTLLGGLGLQAEQAARTLGSSPMRAFWRVTLPMVLPAIVASGSLVFLYTFASFGVPLLLGAGRFNTLEVEIYQLVSQQLKLPEASALALVQLVVTALAAIVYTGFQARLSLGLVQNTSRRPARGLGQVWLGLAVLGALTLTFAPLFALLVRSFWGQSGWTFSNYTRIFAPSDSLFSVSVLPALQNTVLFSLLTLPLALLVGVLLALTIGRLSRHRSTILSRVVDALSLAPLMVSATMLGVAYIVALPSLRASLVLLLAAYTLSAFPFITRASLTALRSIPASTLEVARMLGSTPTRVFWRVELPLIVPAILTGLAFAFASVVGEFAATLVLSRPEWTTLTTAIYQRLGRPGQLGEASALAVLLLVLTLGGFLLLGRLRFGQAHHQPRADRAQVL